MLEHHTACLKSNLAQTRSSEIGAILQKHLSMRAQSISYSFHKLYYHMVGLGLITDVTGMPALPRGRDLRAMSEGNSAFFCSSLSLEIQRLFRVGANPQLCEKIHVHTLM